MNQLQHPRATPVPSHTASTSSVSTASTVIHRPAAAAMDDVTPEVSTDPNPTPARPAAAKAGLFRGRDGGSNFRAPPENRNLPTSNFLINRHKLLRKTEEGKMLHEGGTLSGTRPYLRSSSQNLAPAGSTSPAAAVAAAVDLVAQSSEAKNAHGEHKVSTVTMNMDGMRGAGGHGGHGGGAGGGHGGGAGGGHGGGGGGAENNSYRTTGNYVNERPSSRAAGESLSMVTTTSTENRSSRANLSGSGLPGSGMPTDNQPIVSCFSMSKRNTQFC
ncbi:hypothetical protein BV898_08397 [Hypsibius exemplaris]|uniref:Uncharacterized protein n=1 Tax=Hypsibius exemplaris TaxID=2072580 RepID=A0A1W0WQN7_HYPEX|nr:hypothetical protein BV898_08397 [Hypsibius exemplaris]